MRLRGNSPAIWVCVLLAALAFGAPLTAFADGTSTDPPVDPPEPPPPDPAPQVNPDGTLDTNNTSVGDTAEYSVIDVVWVVVVSML
jgi:hypothetical protein